MRYLKMLGGAVVVAAALMAFGGGGTASATVLCETEARPCTSPYPKGTEIKADHVEDARPKFENQFFQTFAECEDSHLTGQVSNAGGATSTVSISLTSLTWSECEGAPTPVTTKLGSLEVHYTEEGGVHRGVVTASELEIAFEPFCAYKIEPGVAMGLITGSPETGSEAILHIEAKFTRTNPLLPGCSSPIYWLARFRITSPNPLSVASG